MSRIIAVTWVLVVWLSLTPTFTQTGPHSARANPSVLDVIGCHRRDSKYLSNLLLLHLTSFY